MGVTGQILHWCKDGLVIKSDSGAHRGPGHRSACQQWRTFQFDDLDDRTTWAGDDVATTSRKQANAEAGPLVRGLGKATRPETLPLSLTDA